MVFLWDFLAYDGPFEAVFGPRECRKWIRSLNFIQFEPSENPWGLKIQFLYKNLRVFLRFTMVFEVSEGSGAAFLEVRDVEFLDGGPCKLGVLKMASRVSSV